MCSANDDDIADDERRCIQTDVEIPVCCEPQTFSQVDPAARTEFRIGQSGRCIQRYEVIAGRNRDYTAAAIVAFPVGNTHAGALARRLLISFTLVRAPHPERLPGLCIQ